MVSPPGAQLSALQLVMIRQIIMAWLGVAWPKCQWKSPIEMQSHLLETLELQAEEGGEEDQLQNPD